MMKVAVIIPCYNVGSHIETCLNAVCAQSHAELDIICVDDGSSDRTVEIIKRLAQQAPIRLLQQSNQGACSARNAGIAETESEYIQFLDADDVLFPEKIAAQVALIENASSKPDVLIGDYMNVYPGGAEELAVSLYDQDWMGLIKTRLGTTSANLWKRETLLKVGAWSDRLSSSQDYELLFRLMKEDAVLAYDKAVLTRVLKREEGSISQTDKLENWKRYIALRKEIRDHLASRGAGHGAEIAAIDQYLFMAIRVLSQYDMKLALAEHARSIPKGFKPTVSKAISKRYIDLYSIFGFGFSEKVIRFLKPDLYRKQ